MKIVTSSNGNKTVKISKTEWLRIGQNAGWANEMGRLGDNPMSFSEAENLLQSVLPNTLKNKNVIYLLDEKKRTFQSKIDALSINDDFEDEDDLSEQDEAQIEKYSKLIEAINVYISQKMPDYFQEKDFEL